MRLPFYQVDAFTGELFRGNPAGVCPLAEWLPDPVMQSIAAENNLAETAFFTGARGEYHLRWFTPAVEVDLCGHATLASAYVLFRFLEPDRHAVRFHSRSGPLAVTRDGDWLTLDFPALPPRPVEAPPVLARALGAAPLEVLAEADYLAVFGSEAEVRALRPDMRLLTELDRRGVIVTAPGTQHDFVSRFFAPNCGIDEDPATGSAHCLLTPYWADRLSKQELRAKQVSARGGEIRCRLAGDRVRLSGQAVLYLRGEIELPD